MISKKEKIYLALTLIIGAIAAIGGIKCVDLVVKDYQLYQSESECVRKYQMKNYARNEIITGNGTCWIRGIEQ